MTSDDVISIKFRPWNSNCGEVLYLPTKFQVQAPTGNTVSKNRPWRHMASSVSNLGHGIPVVVRSFTYLPSFKSKLLREIRFLKIDHDVILTSPVPNLGHRIPIKVRSFTYLPSFKSKLLREILATGNWQLATGNWQLATGNWQLATGNWQLATGNWQLATGNWQLATGNWQLATGN